MKGVTSIANFESRVLTRTQFDARVAAIYKPLVSHALAAVGPNNADDRVQNALVQAWHLRNDFNSQGDTQDFCNWVLAILDYEVATFLRAERRHRETTLPPALIFAQLDGPSHLGLASDQWCAQRQEMYRRLSCVVLTPRERTCTEAWLDGDSLAWIGAHLEEPLGASAVRKIIGGAAGLLRELDSGDDDSDVGECLRNLPAALVYRAPKRPWAHSPHRPDRHARTRERRR